MPLRPGSRCTLPPAIDGPLNVARPAVSRQEGVLEKNPPLVDLDIHIRLRVQPVTRRSTSQRDRVTTAFRWILLGLLLKVVYEIDQYVVHALPTLPMLVAAPTFLICLWVVLSLVRRGEEYLLNQSAVRSAALLPRAKN